MRTILLSLLTLSLLALPAAKACDYGAAAFSYGYTAGYPAPLLQPYVVPAPAYYAPAIPLGYAAPISYGYSSPFAVSSYGVSSYSSAILAPRVRVFSPLRFRSRATIIVR